MMAHAIDEFVPIEDVVEACKVYALTALDWCGLSGSERRAEQ